MPDAPAVAPPAAPPPAAPPASSAPPAAPPPRVTMGPDTGKPPVEVPAAPPAGAEPELKFDFGFEGQEGEAPAVAEGETDYSKPFDPALEELLKNSPEQLKQAKAAWYDNRNWKASGFKNAQELKAHVAKLETLATSLGRTDGLKGVAAIEAEAKEWKQTWEGFQAGDEGVVKQWFTDLKPEAAAKLMSVADAQLQAKNPQAWSHQKAQLFMSELRAQDSQGNSVLTSLNRLVGLVKDNPDALALLRSIGETVNSLDEISRKAPETPSVQNTEKDEIARAQFDIKIQKLHLRVNPQVQRAVTKAAQVVLNGRKLEPEAMASFTTDIHEEYKRLALADDEFQANAKEYIKANDTEGFERLVRAQVAKKMPDAAKNINRKYRGYNSQEMKDRQAEGAARVEGAAGGSQSGAKMKYTGKMSPNGGPDPSVIDWGRMRQVAGGKSQAEEMIFDHRFFVKGDSKNEYYW